MSTSCKRKRQIVIALTYIWLNLQMTGCQWRYDHCVCARVKGCMIWIDQLRLSFTNDYGWERIRIWWCCSNIYVGSVLQLKHLKGNVTNIEQPCKLNKGGSMPISKKRKKKLLSVRWCLLGDERWGMYASSPLGPAQWAQGTDPSFAQKHSQIMYFVLSELNHADRQFWAVGG